MSRADLNYHIARKRSRATTRAAFICKVCDKTFCSFYLLREHKRKELGAESGSGAQNFDVTQLMGDIDDNGLREELVRANTFW